MKTVAFKPFNNEILVELPKVEEKTALGVIKSKEMIEEELRRLDKFLPVVAVSDLCKQVKLGDYVYISRGNYPNYVEDGIVYLIVNELHALGKRVNVDAQLSINFNK